MSAPGAIASDRTIPEDLHCRACGYNLRGLDRDTDCPECGASIESTVAPAALSRQPHEYLHRLGRGLLIVQLAAIAMLIAGCIAPNQRAGAPAGASVTLGPQSPFTVLLGFASTVGWWFVATPRPPALERNEYWTHRRLRAWILAEATLDVLALAAVLALGLYRLTVPLPDSRPVTLIAAAIAGAGALVWVVRLYGAMRYLGALAPHAPGLHIEPAAGRLARWLVVLAVATGLAMSGLQVLNAGVGVVVLVVGVGSLIWGLCFLGLINRLGLYVRECAARVERVGVVDEA